MMNLEQNIKGLCAKFGLNFDDLLNDFQVDSVYELSIVDLETIAEEYELDLQALLFSPLFDNEFISNK